MYRSHFKCHFMKSVLLAVFFIGVSASLSDANPSGAIAAEQARRAAASQASVSAGGPDLRRIAAPRQQPQTVTGLPAGVLPGDRLDSGEEAPTARTVLSGEPMAPAIGPGLIGERLDRIITVAGHVGYNIVRVGFSPTVLDSPYTFAVMRGNRRVSTLYFSRSMSLVAIR